MNFTITREGEVLGCGEPASTDWVILFPYNPEYAEIRITLRDLVTHIVLAEVEAFHRRQAERRFIDVLTEREIMLAAKNGKVDMGGRPLKQKVNPQAAVRTALQAFEDGFYYIFVDGEPKETLDCEVQLRPNSEVSFVRLVPLVGG